MDRILVSAEAAVRSAKIRKKGNGPKWTPPNGDQIRALRKRLKLSQTEFAEVYGLELSSLRNWEQDRSVPEGTSRQVLWMIDTDPHVALNLVTKAKSRSFA